MFERLFDGDALKAGVVITIVLIVLTVVIGIITL